MARYDIPFLPVGISNFAGAGTNYVVESNGGSLYYFYINSANDMAFVKSTNGGKEWSAPTVFFTGTVTGYAVWYDRWSGLTSDLIHVAYTESVNSDTLYRTINTASSDALSTQTVIFSGTSAVAAGSAISITRSRGGNVYCKTTIDAGAEGGFFRLPNANVPNGAWDAARTDTEALATLDQFILVPGFAADNQDIMCIFWDSSADEISRYVHDDSANTWAETSIATTMVERNASSDWPNMSAAVDLTNNRIYLAAWSNTDSANADLRFWRITETGITEQTNVVLNGTDDQGMCAVQIDTSNGDVYVYYGGKSDGTETYNTAINCYYKKSSDGGASWGSELNATNTTNFLRNILTIPRSSNTNILKVALFDSNRAVMILSQDFPTGGGEFGYSYA